VRIKNAEVNTPDVRVQCRLRSAKRIEAIAPAVLRDARQTLEVLDIRGYLTAVIITTLRAALCRLREA
jgi:hypothetical protein